MTTDTPSGRTCMKRLGFGGYGNADPRPIFCGAEIVCRCGHAFEAHRGHTIQPPHPEPTYCSQHDGCTDYDGYVCTQGHPQEAK